MKLTTVSKGGADMGTVVPSDALSKTEGKVPAASGVGLGIHHALYTRSLLFVASDIPYPAPVDRQFIPLFSRFYTSQVVQDIFHQQYGYSNEPLQGSLLTNHKAMSGLNWLWSSKLAIKPA